MNPPAKEQIEASAKKIKELQKERIATLEEVVNQATANFQNARTSYDEILKAQMLLLHAKLDAAEKESERIDLYTKTIELLKRQEEFATAQVAAARATKAAVLNVKARRLEVEIQLEQAKLKQAKQGK